MTGHFIDPTREDFAALKELPRDHPVDMLNLVRLREQAAYEDGRVATGAEAYAAYGRESLPVFEKVGGKIIWSGDPQFMVIGPSDEHWDIAFIARYPSGQAFLNMVYDPDYQAVVHHRQAAVQTSRLIRMGTRESGAGFGE
jgi:uncharacterized protein (DUF1330 family)